MKINAVASIGYPFWEHNREHMLAKLEMKAQMQLRSMQLYTAMDMM